MVLNVSVPRKLEKSATTFRNHHFFVRCSRPRGWVGGCEGGVQRRRGCKGVNMKLTMKLTIKSPLGEGHVNFVLGGERIFQYGHDDSRFARVVQIL